MTAKPERSDQTLDELRRENDELRTVLGELRQRLREPEDIIRALRHGEVDALVVTEPRGERIYSLRSADVLYRGMIENMKEGALVLDHGGVVVYCNAYFAELIEVDRAAILGTSILPRIPEESRPFFSNLQQPGRREGAEERLRGEIVLRSQSGELVPLFATTNRLEVDEHDLICVILTDLRGQKREQELLEQSRRKDEFLAMLAHELRNPLAPIRNAASLLTVAAPNEARLQRARGVIDRQVNHLTRLIDDLLDVSRITRGKIRLEPEPIDLAVAISRSVETARPLVEAHRHHFSVELPSEPLFVNADLTRLSQALANLLNNAAKFTPDGGTITLAAHRTGPMVEVSVRDSGIGIAPDMLPRIFDSVHPGGRDARTVAGGARHRSDAGAELGRDARRKRRGAQRWGRAGERVRSPPPRAERRRRRGQGTDGARKYRRSAARAVGVVRGRDRHAARARRR